ncbi:polyprenyl synthetase family protein [Nocardia sp. NPDC004260]
MVIEQTLRNSADAMSVEVEKDLHRVEVVLSEFMAGKESRAVTPQIPLFVDWLRDFLVGGKRLRPLLCLWGWRAAGAAGDVEVVARVAASLELFHAFALIQDDVMDGSATRRGRPAAHMRIAADHADHRAAARFGANTATLLGDLALGWSYDLVHQAGLTAAQGARVWPLLDDMRMETVSGQYLDLLSEGVADVDLGTVVAICRYKTAKYTMERPLQLGAVLSGADDDLLAACTAYALPLGEAFQLRDDLLGLYGDPAVTGKSRLDDLREGKCTVPLVLACERADTRQRRRLAAAIGNPAVTDAHVEEIRDILTATGARAEVERMIRHRCLQALSVLESDVFPDSATAMLRRLAEAAADRDR